MDAPKPNKFLPLNTDLVYKGQALAKNEVPVTIKGNNWSLYFL